MCARWNISPHELDKKVAAGTLQGWKEISQKRTEVSKNVPKNSESGEKFPKNVQSGANKLVAIKKVLDEAGIKYVTEYRFHDVRRFKFDIAFPELKIAIEYEGLVATGKKGGHQTKGGYTSNCTKYNLATSMGWKVYRYTSRNYKEFSIDLLKPR